MFLAYGASMPCPKGLILTRAQRAPSVASFGLVARAPTRCTGGDYARVAERT